MRRRFLPDVIENRNQSLGAVQDKWFGTESLVFGAPPSHIEQAVKYKEKAIEFTRHALMLLENPDAIKIPFTVKSFEEDPLQIELLARNMFLRHVNEQLMVLYVIANQKEESEKEKTDREFRNSAK